MKKIRNTLDGFELTKARASGNSTRQIDLAINLLFNGFTVKVMDHFKSGTDIDANKFLLYRILKRLKDEHGLGGEDNFYKVIVDRSKLTIEIF